MSNESGGDRALRDWANRAVVLPVFGLLATDRPLFDRERGFYVSQYADYDDGSGENVRFCTEYQSAIDELLARHGIPEWAPGRRFPSRDSILEDLKRHEPFAAYRPASWKEGRLVEWVLKRWAEKPTAWRRVPERGLLLLAGHLNPRCGAVDVLDTAEDRWMAHVEFMRRHFPALPWDRA